MSQEQTPPTEILTEHECAKRLSVTRETLSRWRRDKNLPFVRMGEGPRPRIRYAWDRVIEWLRERESNVSETPAKRGRGRPRNVERAARTPDAGRGR